MTVRTIEEIEIGTTAEGKYIADRLLAGGLSRGESQLERVHPRDPYPL
jgi:hypothetical protein